MKQARTWQRGSSRASALQAVEVCRALWAAAGAGLVLSAALLIPLPAAAQERPPSTQERLSELERRVDELEGQLESERAAKEAAREDVERLFSRGVVTLGGLHFRLGGQAKIDFVDPQAERDPLLGSTDSPDPHLEVDRIRLVPRVEFPRSRTLGQLSLRGQLDFHPTQGDTILKEATLDHRASHSWWLASVLKIGLDDRFIRPRRLTQNYPLSGTAFWRDESVAIFWEGTLGDRRGRPEEGRSGRRARRQARGGEGAEEAAPEEEMEARAGKEAAEEDGEPVPSRGSRSRSTAHGPLDFAGNPGALKIHFSIGDGYGQNGKEIGKDNATFDEVLQDDRDLDPPLSMREVGVGLGYERDFRELGEIELLGFYYNDELRDDSAAFLRSELTERNPLTLAAIRGFGDSDRRASSRRGVNAGYHYESYHFLQSLGLLDSLNPRRGDGLYLFYQWIGAEDSELDRTGWYAQASYRLSNPWDWKYLRSIEPVVRYGELNVDQAHIPGLPLTWSRRQWLVGAVLGVVRGVFVRAEYTFNDETTGAGGIANNELLVQLLAVF